MNRKIVSLLMLVLMASPSITVLVGAAPLTVDTDRPYYVPGEYVEIHGTAEPNAIVTIIVNSTQGTMYNFTVSADTDGIYNATVSLPVEALYGHYIVTASADEATAIASFMVTLTDATTLAEGLLSLIENSREQVEAAFDELEAEEIDVPEGAMDSYEQGVEAAEEALQLMEEGKYSAAYAKALQALQRFRIALHLIQVIGPERPTEDTEEEAERAIGLKEAIERAYEFLERFNGTADRLFEEGYDVEEIRTNLEEANYILGEAEELLDLGDIDGATQILAEARGILGRTTGLLHSTAKRVKSVKTERFLEHVESRIQSVEESVNRLRHHISEGQVVLNSLKNTRTKLWKIRSRLAAGEVEDVVDELDDTVGEIDDEVDELNGRGISVFIKEMNRLEVKIRVLKATAEKWAKKGADTFEVEEELQSAKGLLEEMMIRLEEGDTEAAEDLLEEIEEALPENREITQIKKHSKIVEKVMKWLEQFKKWRPEDEEG